MPATVSTTRNTSVPVALPTQPTTQLTEPATQLPTPASSSPEDIVNAAIKRAPDEANWNTHLVNLHHPLPDDYQSELAGISTFYSIDQATVYYLDARAISDLHDMLAAASAADVPIFVTSAFRPRSLQVSIYENEVQSYLNLGYSQEDAVVLGGSYVAYPGTSEHQLGLAVDLVSLDHYWLDDSFENTAAFAWLRENAAGFGFIMRYPKDKTHITGIAYEPWHYRYVGAEHALLIGELGLCLEEYLLR